MRAIWRGSSVAGWMRAIAVQPIAPLAIQPRRLQASSFAAIGAESLQMVRGYSCGRAGLSSAATASPLAPPTGTPGNPSPSSAIGGASPAGPVRRPAAIPEPTKGTVVPVKAYYIAGSIEISQIKPSSIYKFVRKEQRSTTFTLNEEQNQHISIFKYGSVVFFNVPEELHAIQLLDITKKFVTEMPIPIEKQLTDDYNVIVHEALEHPSVIKAEHLNIRYLDTNNIHIVGTVMAQTVALDHYAMSVEKMLEKFGKMNTDIIERGSFEKLDAKELYRFIATNNITITNMLAKLGLFESLDAAWDNADYYDTLNALRKDFEIDQRYKDLSNKLDLVKDDTRFYLEVLQHQKSTKLEWIIIILIAGEFLMNLAGLIKGYIVSAP